MRAIRYTASRQFAVVDLLKSEPGPRQMVIRVRACGICKTDLIIHDGSFLAKFPPANGHEFADVINSVGSAVTEWKMGDRVIADNTELCGHCEPCRSDKSLYCENFNFYGCNMSGGLAGYMLANHDKVFALSDRSPFEEAIFTKPTAHATHGVNRIAPRFGDSTLVLGASPIGVTPAQLLHWAGTDHMVIANPHADRLNILRKYGFTDLVVMGRADPSKHTAEIRAIMPKDFDIVIDAVGAASVFESYSHFVCMGSKIVVYGVCVVDTRVPVSSYDILSQEYTALGSFAQIHYFDRALKYLESGAVQVEGLISRELPLEGYDKGLDYIVQKQARRVIIHP